MAASKARATRVLLSWPQRQSFQVAAFAFVLLVCGFLSTPAPASIIFSENFDSLADGNLSGQGGWTGDDMRIGTGAGLGTKVVDGRIDPGTGIQSFSIHAIGSLSSIERYTLDFDLYAHSTGPESNAAGAYFSDSSSSLSVGWNWAGFTFLDWQFDARVLTGNSGNIEFLTGVFDTAVDLQVILDPFAGEVYGRADLGSGFVETTHFAMTAAQFATVNSVLVFQDFRSPTVYLGLEVDNITVDAVVIPEPSALALMLIPLLFLLRRRAIRS